LIDVNGYLVDRLARPHAVLVVDAQRAFFADDGSWAKLGYDVAPMRAALPKIGALIGRARMSKVPVIHVRTVGAHWLNWPRHVAPPELVSRLVARHPEGGMLVEGSRDVELAPEATPLAGEPVITKHAYDAFNGTPLALTLRHLGVETVVLAGLTTDGCVDTTARSALCHGFAVILAHDAMATEQPLAHEASLAVLGRLVGPAASVEEIVTTPGW
jgi:nicotinamidase-related amidase